MTTDRQAHWDRVHATQPEDAVSRFEADPSPRVALVARHAPDGPERCSGLPVRRHGQADFEALLGPGFATEASFAEEHLTPGGAVQRFRTHVARRSA